MYFDFTWNIVTEKQTFLHRIQPGEISFVSHWGRITHVLLTQILGCFLRSTSVCRLLGALKIRKLTSIVRMHSFDARMGDAVSNTGKKGWLVAILELGAWFGVLVTGASTFFFPSMHNVMSDGPPSHAQAILPTNCHGSIPLSWVNDSCDSLRG